MPGTADTTANTVKLVPILLFTHTQLPRVYVLKKKKRIISISCLKIFAFTLFFPSIKQSLNYSSRYAHFPTALDKSVFVVDVYLENLRILGKVIE